jgi:hypothetical protein
MRKHPNCHREAKVCGTHTSFPHLPRGSFELNYSHLSGGQSAAETQLERRLSAGLAGGGLPVRPCVSQPFWPEGGKSRGIGGSAPELRRQRPGFLLCQLHIHSIVRVTQPLRRGIEVSLHFVVKGSHGQLLQPCLPGRATF